MSLGQAHSKTGDQILLKILMNAIDKQSEDFEAFPESNLDDDDPKTKTPDIVIVDNDLDKIVFAIEITTKGLLYDVKKRVVEFVLQYGFEESFIIVNETTGFFEYEVQEWYKVTPDGIEKGNSFSDILNVDLDDLLNEE